MEPNLKTQIVAPGPRAEIETLARAALELDTLALARLGRQEQARYMAELAAAGVKGLAELTRGMWRAFGARIAARTSLALKGN